MILRRSSILYLFFLGLPLLGEGETFHCYYLDGTYRDLNPPPELLLQIKGEFLQVEEKHRDLNPTMEFRLGGNIFAVGREGAESLLEACYPGMIHDREHFKPLRDPAEIRVSGSWMGYYSNSALSYAERVGYPVVVQFDQNEQNFFRLNENYFDYLTDRNLSDKKPVRAPLPTLRDPLPALSHLAGWTVQYTVIDPVVERLKMWVENEVFRLANQDPNKTIMKLDGKWIEDTERIIVDRNPEPTRCEGFS
jgi:hypothetical protein